MIVSELCIYPLKSCQGITLTQAEVTSKGFAQDREFMLVTQKGKFLTQRQFPQLAKVQVQISAQQVSLSLLDSQVQPLTFQPTLTGTEIEVEIWLERTIAIDQGDEVAEWFHTFLKLDSQKKCRLVRQSPQHIRPINRKYATQAQEPVSFADSHPYLLTATASLDELNHRIKDMEQQHFRPVSMNQFRPNIVVETEQSFVEGNWKSIQIGTVRFILVKPCSRCIITTTNQQTGITNPSREPLRTLGTFRQFGEQGVLFGEYMIPQNQGIIQVGDRVKVLEVRGENSR
ncbi:MAG: MOSC domain-containing protein [Xenococcaceae cyanobacterium]